MTAVKKTPIKRHVGDGTPGPGRPKGSVNKVPADVRQMVVNALERAGGETYLLAQAKKNPKAFLALVGKCLPKDVNLGAGVGLAEMVAASLKK